MPSSSPGGEGGRATFEYPLVEGVKTQRVLVPLADIVKPELTAGDLVDLKGTQSLLQDAGVLP